jgi:hypothetical protein
MGIAATGFLAPRASTVAACARFLRKSDAVPFLKCLASWLPSFRLQVAAKIRRNVFRLALKAEAAK